MRWAAEVNGLSPGSSKRRASLRLFQANSVDQLADHHELAAGFPEYISVARAAQRSSQPSTAMVG